MSRSNVHLLNLWEIAIASSVFLAIVIGLDYVGLCLIYEMFGILDPNDIGGTGKRWNPTGQGSSGKRGDPTELSRQSYKLVNNSFLLHGIGRSCNALLIPTGGASTGALALAGGGSLGGGVAISTTTVAETCAAGSVGALGAVGVLAAKGRFNSNSSSEKHQLKKCNDNDLQQYVEKQGYDRIEDFKEAEVGEGNASKFNVKYDPDTGQMYLERISSGEQIPLYGDYWK